MKPLIVANWKCNPTTLKGAKLLFNSIRQGIKNIKNAEVVICPPFIFLSNIQHPISNIKLGAQNCFWEEKGAFTGEVSSKMLKDLGRDYVILGHSERRRYLKETDEMINKKIKAALKAKLKPILCVGETEEERKKDKTSKVLKNQLQRDLKGILNLKSKILNLVVAYEPVWAIGTGNPCDIDEAQKMSLLIRKIIGQFYGRFISENFRILYGGSVNSKNARDYIKKAFFQGLLVGGASLDPEEFTQIVKNVSQRNV